MRIVAGEFRSRNIQAVPGDTTRPTSDKIKGAIFSRIGPYFDGGILLDLFGGSGNIGFEALSRGIKEVYTCDCNAKAIATMKANAAALQVEKRCYIRKCDAWTLLKALAQEQKQFDLIYLDPPYRKQENDEMIMFIAQHGLLKPQGDLVCESLCEDVFQENYGDIYKVKEATYRLTRITYYTR